MAEYKFECDDETLREVNTVEAMFGLTHEEFVVVAAQYAKQHRNDFEAFLEKGDERRRRNR